MDSLLDKTESWQDVFINYSIPNTRKFEQIARENAIAKKQELQALVSKSYRHVMNTADTIIQMHRQMDLTMDQISAMRITCTGISLQKRIKVTRYMESNLHPSNHTHSTFRFIHECLSTSRKMQCCNKILPACRLFLVCQKLVAYLSSHSEMRLPRLRDDLAFHKLSLANAIDRVSTSRDSPISTISASLCAFALVAGSSTIDTLKYFLNARKKYIYNQLVDGDSGTRVHALMQIISSTMHDSVVIFTDLYPHLANLICSAPIIQDVKEPEIDLNLIKHLKDHLDTFVPWIKADPLPSSIISGICQQWLKDVTRLLKENIGLKIAGYSSIKGILAEENEIVLMIHIDDEASAMADCWNFTLKPCVHERILELFNQSLQQFTSLSVDIESTDSPVLPLWNTTVFLESSQPHILVKSLDLAAKGCTHQLQTFWDKHYTIVLAINADLELLHKNVDGTANLELLGEIEARIQAAYEHIQLKLTTVYQSLYSPDCAQICALLRVISRFRAHPLAPSQYRPSEMFGLDLVECMSEELAELVMGKHISRYSEFLNMQTWSTEIPEAALFEGSPGIPQNPLAAISVLLAASCRDIAMLGPDLLLDDLVQRFRFKILQDVDHISRRLLENCKVENIAIDKNIELPQPKVDQQSELVDGNDELDQPKFDGNNTEQSETEYRAIRTS
ncbi:hypothetical protein NEOLI_004901 [Neolecta irregularis DAH-3]|uniref:Conserved oligomeric Golgi complex subunit 1 n=1 Tax=Neolecta irregularis (strain DAH-3) TaxID=1198029 RepID=A0A1U7LHX0_NEOID|nr:hypothetical protein NEOLI_004901 [Neolecta irregularis DAH-3]|eukprot:OLL22244.1 hypothetical protein NEOLI_004901 [Neolecta irregularis DAH-3]